MDALSEVIAEFEQVYSDAIVAFPGIDETHHRAGYVAARTGLQNESQVLDMLMLCIRCHDHARDRRDGIYADA